MSSIKKLAGQTMIYGLGTIAPRLLNYLLLTPFYTAIFQQNEYGVVTELYAYVAFLMVILTYGMETTYFRFVELESNKNKVFSTAALSLLTTTSIFVFFMLLFVDDVAGAIKYSSNPEYITYFVIIVGLDAFMSIPFAKLRHENRPIRFTYIKIANIGLSIFLNILFLVIMPKWSEAGSENFLMQFYSPDIGVGYAFIANLIATSFTFLLLLPEILSIRFIFDWKLYKKMLNYAWPLIIIGIAGMINEVSDKFVFKHIVDVPEGVVNKDEYIMSLIGVYGANTKLAVLMTLFIQMFKFAAEPFFFNNAKNKDAKSLYADVMKYFVVFGLIIFLGVMLYLDVVKYFINTRFHEGLFVVPIILLGNLFLGIFYNLSIWYKLNDLTRLGAVIALIGASITLIINFVFVPLYSYEASAWAHFICYFSMMVISYFWGRKYYPVNYPLTKILLYFALALALVYIHSLLPMDTIGLGLRYLLRTLLFLSFVTLVFVFEKKQLKSFIH